MEYKSHFTGCTINTHPCRCFEKLTDDEKKMLDANSVIVKYKKKEIICKQGSLASHVMYMERGLAKVFLEEGTSSLILKIIPEGSLLSLSSVSDDRSTFQYSAMAYIDCEIRQIDLKIFKQFLNQNAAFSKEVIDILSANSLQVYGRFFCLTQKQAFGRLADILLCLSDRVFKQSEFDLPLSRRDLADLSGMSSETVVRMLKKFNDEGIIKMVGKRFEVIDYDRLKRISETG